MSYANGTEHYNLPQTVGTDKRDWFDTNTAFQNVDADLHSAKQTADSVATDVTSLTTRVGTAEGDITALATRVGNAEGDISALQSGQTSLGNQIGDVKADLSDAICAVKEADATADYAHAVGTYFWYNDTLYITTQAIAVGDTIVPNTNCNTTNVTSELLLKQAKTDNSLNTTSKEIVGAINELKSAIDRGSVSVTADGVKTLSQLLDSLYALADRDKINKDSKIVDSSGVITHISTMTADRTVFDFGAVRAICQLYNYRMKVSASTAYKVDFNADSLVRTTMDSVVYTAGRTLTLYY